MSITEYPLVSIVVVTYNSSKYVLEALESAKVQTYENIELIITDDGSKDDTIAICEKWIEANKHYFRKIQLIPSPKNLGTAINLNQGISHADGDWIKTIAGDDVLFPNIVQEYINFIKFHPSAEFVHSQAVPYAERFDENCRLPLKVAKNYKINRDSITAKEQSEILLRVCLINAPSVMIKKDVFKRIGYFSEEYPLWEDRPMWYKITKNGVKLHYIDIKGIKYRVRINSISNNKISKTLISPFAIYKSRALLNTLLYELPLPERMLKLVAYQWYIKFSEYNSQSKIVILFYYVSVFPLMALVDRVNQQYR